MAQADQWNRSRNGVAKRAVNAACRAIGSSQGGTQIASTPYTQVEAGRGDPARDNASPDLIPPAPWGGNQGGTPGRYCGRDFGPEDNVTFNDGGCGW